MPFDGTNFLPEPSPQAPEMPSDKVISRFVLFLAISLFITPFSMFGLVDLVNFITGR
ncbi:hypothetical protein [Acidisoma sp. C75]